MKTLNLGISDFALPSPRQGSISTYSGYGGLPNVGAAIHFDIQMQRLREKPGYVVEKWVTHTFSFSEQFKIAVSGRMDGFLLGAPTWIEEIKSTYNVDELLKALSESPDHPYKLQLRTYGYIHYLQSGGSTPFLNLHLVHARSRQTHDLEIALDVPAYEAWLKRRLMELVALEAEFLKLKKRRKNSAKGCAFPFSAKRPGQSELMDTVATALTQERARVLLQAPTGLGKTAGVLIPALQQALRRGQKTIYLTAKNTQHEVAEDAVERLQNSGTKVKSLTLHAKAKMCFQDEPQCDPDHCAYAKNHYDKMEQHQLVNQLRKKKRLTFERFRRTAKEHEVCPFELQLDLVPFADVVICDYNYVFSPRNALGRLTQNGFSSSSTSKPNLVIDEVHNLPARATDYFSATLSGVELEQLVSATPLEIRSLAISVTEALSAMLDEVIENRGPNANPQKLNLTTERFLPVQARAQELMARYLESALELRTQDPVLKLCNLVTDFSLALELANDEFFITWSPGPAGGTLKFTCCDASSHLREAYDNFHGVVGFSATCKPFDFYTRLLGLSQTDGPLTTAEFESPFPRGHRKLLVIPQISTKMRDRQRNFDKIKQTIEKIVQLKRGNYFVFFPSFEFMRQVHSRVQLPDFKVVLQEREMRRESIDQLLNDLRLGIPTIVFAVQGSVLSEGVDYPGDMLIGAFVVGPALPTFDFERELLREYFDRKHGSGLGFDYAYTYPAMARVIQSAGRVIRSSDDRGLIILMDQRFLHDSYRKSMPRDWLEGESFISTQILEDVRRFWEENHEGPP